MSTGALATGRFTASTTDATVLPRIPKFRPGRPVVVYNHTAAGDAHESMGTPFPAVEKLLSKLADEGFSVVAPSQGLFESPTGGWGNDKAQTRDDDAIAFGRTTIGLSDEPVVLIGHSMGSACCLRRAALHPEQVACVVTGLTIASLTYAYWQNLGGNRTSIGNAYGVTWPTPLPADADYTYDAGMTEALSQVPLLLHHSSDDAWSVGNTPTVHPTPIEDLQAATGATVVDVGALGHTNASIAAADFEQILEFIREHAL